VWTVNLLSGALIGSSPDYTLIEQDTPVQCVALDISGRFVACGAEDGSIILWDIDGGRGAAPSRSSGVPVHLFSRQIAPFGRSALLLD
jgi:WD40 repeat protein